MNDGCKIHYSHHINADKPTLVLSNSLGTTMLMWEPQLAELKKHFSILRYDARGHGQSDSFPGAYCMDRLGCDLIELMDFLQLEKVHYCGLSIGGMIGQWLAVRHPERIDSLVLANTSAYIGPSSLWQDRINHVKKSGLPDIWDNILARWFTSDFISAEPDTVAQMKNMFMSIDAQGYIACCAAIRDMDMRNYACLNKLRTLIIAGTQDLATPIEQSEYLLEQYDNAQLVELNAGHLSNIEQPDQFGEALLTFLL